MSFVSGSRKVKSRWGKRGKLFKRAVGGSRRKGSTWAWLIAVAGLIGSLSSHGQEALRMSIASEEAAQARRDAAKLGYCNLRWGSVTARVQANMGFEMSDNIDYQGTNPQSDIAFRPGVLIKSLWPITDLNSLYFSSGLGYLKFFKHSNFDSFYVTPDSAITFQMYSGDFVINLHDRFTLTDSGAQTPTINSVTGYGRLENTAGVGVDWDLNDMIVSFNYDHDLLASTKTQYEYVDHNSDLASVRAVYLLSPRLRAGIDAAGGYNYYSLTTYPNSFYYSAGPFVEVDLSKFLRARLSGGYVNYMFQNHDLDGRSSMDSYYAKLSIDHQISKRMWHSLNIQHNLALGEWYAMGDLNSIYYSFNWSLNNRLLLNAAVGYYSGRVFNPRSQNLSWVGPSISCSYRIGPKLTASAVYNFTAFTSNTQNTSWNQNRLALNLSYTF